MLHRIQNVNDTKKQCQLHGFTLVELLVVISIIALLLAILMPSLGKAREGARKIVCGVNLKNFGLAMAMYIQTTNKLPWEGHADGDKASNPVGPWDEPSFWANALPVLAGGKSYDQMQQEDMAGRGKLPTAGMKSIFVCPTAREAKGSTGDTVKDGCFMMWGGKAGTSYPDNFLGGGNQEQRKVFWSYVWNSKLNNNTVDHPNILNIRTTLSTVPILVEKMMRVDEIKPAYRDTLARGKTANTRFTARHSGGGQLLFLDSHVGYLARNYVNTTDQNRLYNKPGTVVWDPFGDY
jgi:prepilin-type N-terminal cleavage/methylation domain-containing protein/prepilin-type processing-associated H-X9-DG protein